MNTLHHPILHVALETPLDTVFDYQNPWCHGFNSVIPQASYPQIGHLVQVTFSRRQSVGVIVGGSAYSQISEKKLKPISAIYEALMPLPADWLALCRFAAEYYQRALGQVMLSALPKKMRMPFYQKKNHALDRALNKMQETPYQAQNNSVCGLFTLPTLHPAQANAVQRILCAKGFFPVLLHGITGSGKTEVYLHTTAALLARYQEIRQPAQILILVPEINLTPQFEAQLRARFPGESMATLHSELAEGKRLSDWLSVHLGHARIILGTRLAILASIPYLQLIIVDEEHDMSYKQQDGLRYSARDLAVWRAQQRQIPVILGSATPSLETWHHASHGRYYKLALTERAVAKAQLPVVHLINVRPIPHDVYCPKTHFSTPLTEGLTTRLIEAIQRRLTAKEQSLLFLNRRGYAPVIHCEACGWLSQCTRCTAFMVLHKAPPCLRCHHCAWVQKIPKACPTCGNIDLQPCGRGTQRLEEGLQTLFPTARILRIDADATRHKGSAQNAFARVHGGDVDILVGTQMVTKGHDFKRLSLVGVLNPDIALFSHDYRASERLFAQLMQVTGRAGRFQVSKDTEHKAEVMIQTRYPDHPLYKAIVVHDYDGFAQRLLEERRTACLPPFVYQALLCAQAKQLEKTLDFLRQAVDCAATCSTYVQNLPSKVILHDPIPMTVTRIANVERAQLLVESSSRPVLQAFLTQWRTKLKAMKIKVTWFLEVDPVVI